jgi:hypothetical protein
VRGTEGGLYYKMTPRSQQAPITSCAFAFPTLILSVGNKPFEEYKFAIKLCIIFCNVVTHIRRFIERPSA